MRTIYKYPIDLNEPGTPKIDLPLGAKVLSVAQDFNLPGGKGRLVLWAMVEPDAEKRPADIRIFGTAFELPVDLLDSHQFLGTVVDGSFVWHVFVPLTLV